MAFGAPGMLSVRAPANERARELAEARARLVREFRSSPTGAELDGVGVKRNLEATAQKLFPLLSENEQSTVLAAAWSDLFGLGPLDPILSDSSVSEVMINGVRSAWVERNGRVSKIDLHISEDMLLSVIERIFAPLGQRIDRLHPYADGRLPDGSRVHAAIPPVAIDGPTLTIRKFTNRKIPLGAFADRDLAIALAAAVSDRRSIVVCGGTGSGKTTLLNALGSLIPCGERVITIEDTAELQIEHSHVVRLEARHASAEGLGSVSMRDLVRTSLRMRPDRIVVGEVRGAEALDMVQAMSTGHHGSMSTVHANNAHEALRRLELMLLMADLGLRETSVREQLSMAMDVVVHVERSAEGLRKISSALQARLVDDRWTYQPLVAQ